MKMRKIAVQRVYPLREYENIRIQIEAELDESENPREVAYLLNEEIMTMERVLALFQYAKESFSKLVDYVESGYGTRYNPHPDRFSEFKEKTKELLDEKLKTLGCLEKVDMNNIEALTACMESLGIRTISEIGKTKESLKKTIKEMEEHLRNIDDAEKRYRELKAEFPKTISKAKDFFVFGQYEEAQRILRDLQQKIKDLKQEIEGLDPEHYRYRWR